MIGIPANACRMQNIQRSWKSASLRCSLLTARDTMECYFHGLEPETTCCSNILPIDTSMRNLIVDMQFEFGVKNRIRRVYPDWPIGFYCSAQANRSAGSDERMLDCQVYRVYRYHYPRWDRHQFLTLRRRSSASRITASLNRHGCNTMCFQRKAVITCNPL